jgi:Domain of unknown function (DUF4349)
MFHRRSIVPVLAATAVALALAGCGGGGGGEDSSGASGPRVASSGEAPSAQSRDEGSSSDGSGSSDSGGSLGSKGSGTPGTSAGSVTPAALQAERDQLARRASVAVQVTNINQAVAKVRAATAAVDGFVLSEHIGGSSGAAELRDSARVTATTYGEITISVPSAQLDKVVAELAGLGKVIRSTSTSENVGAQIVDTESRVQTMRTSVERVRALLADADDLSQVVAIEAELTRRQSDLESLQAQLAALKGSVSRSPVQVSLTTDPGVIAEDEEDATGFLVGLESGWSAFTASVAVALTVVGALLPFVVLAALVIAPLWWVLRRRRPAATPPAPQTAVQ